MTQSLESILTVFIETVFWDPTTQILMYDSSKDVKIFYNLFRVFYFDFYIDTIHQSWERILAHFNFNSLYEPPCSKQYNSVESESNVLINIKVMLEGL